MFDWERCLSLSMAYLACFCLFRCFLSTSFFFFHKSPQEFYLFGIGQPVVLHSSEVTGEAPPIRQTDGRGQGKSCLGLLDITSASVLGVGIRKATSKNEQAPRGLWKALKFVVFRNLYPGASSWPLKSVFFWTKGE